MQLGFDAKRAFRNFTGLGNYARFLLQGMAQVAPNNEYLLFTPNAPEHPETKFLRQPPFSVQLPGKPWFGWRSIGLGKQAAGVDLFHGLSHELPFDLPATVPTVLTVHDLIFLQSPGDFPFFDRLGYRVKYRLSARRADHIIAISHATAGEVETRYGISPEKISVIPPAVDPRFYQPVPPETVSEVKSRYELPEDYLLSVGSIVPRKNLGRTIGAWLEVPDAPPLVVVGSGGSYWESLRKQYGNHPGFRRLLWKPEVAHADLPALYAGALLSVYPSLFEGFGLPVAESLAQGTPVITSNRSSLPEAGGAGALTVDPEDGAALGSAITQLLESPAKRNELVQAGKNHVEQFRPEVIARRTLGLYDRLLK